MKKINIAIDGYSSCGKSTIAKQVAEIVGYLYIDSGAMYRAVALYALETGTINAEGQLNKSKLLSILKDIHINLDFNTENKTTITFLNGKNVENEIRTMRVSNVVSVISEIIEVREKLVELQQKLAEAKGVVMDGRDIGSVVLPKAELKIFMTADATVRAERRFKELVSKGKEEITLEAVKQNIESRDTKDVSRNNSPLVQTDDAIILDNTYLTFEEQLTFVINMVNKLVAEEVA